MPGGREHFDSILHGDIANFESSADAGVSVTMFCDGCFTALQAAAAGLPPATAGVSGKRSGSAREGCAWFGRKKQKTTDTPDVAHAALSSGCEQPAAILGMVPCPTEANILVRGSICVLNQYHLLRDLAHADLILLFET